MGRHRDEWLDVRTSPDDEYDDYDYQETLKERKEKMRRKTEMRRKMEDKLERRRLAEELGYYPDERLD